MQGVIFPTRLQNGKGYDYDRLQRDTIGKQIRSGFSQFISEKIRKRSMQEKRENKSGFTRENIATGTPTIDVLPAGLHIRQQDT